MEALNASRRLRLLLAIFLVCHKVVGSAVAAPPTLPVTHIALTASREPRGGPVSSQHSKEYKLASAARPASLSSQSAAESPSSALQPSPPSTTNSLRPQDSSGPQVPPTLAPKSWLPTPVPRKNSWLRRRPSNLSEPPRFAGHVAVSQQDLWTSGAGGYNTFRIPAIVSVGGGVVLAFCEGRRLSSADWGDIDVVMKRSTDGGVTWDDDEGDGDDHAEDGNGDLSQHRGFSGGGDGEDGNDRQHQDGLGGRDGSLGTAGNDLGASTGRRNRLTRSGSNRPSSRGDWAGRVICSNGHDTCDNPTPVYDAVTGRVLLLVNAQLGNETEHLLAAGRGSGYGRKTFLYISDDKGLSWHGPEDITGYIARPGWDRTVVGPGGGIQLTSREGGHVGRVVVACDFVDSVTKAYGSYVIFSDDHGYTWQRGGTVDDPRVPSNEATVAELANGTLVMNMRVMQTRPHARRARAVATSFDAGASWVDVHYNPTLPDPSCEGSLHFVRGRDVLLFSNAASPVARERMTVRASRDGGASWPHALLLHYRNAAYSSLTTIQGRDGTLHVLCLYEAGMEDDGPLVPQGGAHYKRMRLARFPLEDLLALKGIGMAEKPGSRHSK